MKVLYHECTDSTGVPLPVDFLDGNGKLWSLPFGEPVEFENAFMADRILEHMRYMGVVEVNFTKTRTGITYNMEDAVSRAHLLLVEQEKACINDYIKTQLESRVRQNFPPLPPVGRAYECVVKHKVNLLKYGVRPVGWEPPYEMEGGTVDNGISAPLAANSADLSDRIRSMERMIESQQKMIDSLIHAKQTGVSAIASPPSAREILAADATPPPPPAIDVHDGADDTYESISL